MGVSPLLAKAGGNPESGDLRHRRPGPRVRTWEQLLDQTIGSDWMPRLASVEMITKIQKQTWAREAAGRMGLENTPIPRGMGGTKRPEDGEGKSLGKLSREARSTDLYRELEKNREGTWWLRTLHH